MRPGKKIEILVLDDEAIVCARLKPALEKSGYIVETFTDSLQARDRLDQHRFDIVVTDLKMANLDGIELFRFVKKRWPDTDVIIISGFATAEVAREALEKGARKVIPKPFKISHLKEVIDAIVNQVKRSTR